MLKPLLLNRNSVTGFLALPSSWPSQAGTSTRSHRSGVLHKFIKPRMLQRRILGGRFLKGKAGGDTCSSHSPLSVIEGLRAGVSFGLVEIAHAFETRRYWFEYHFCSLIAFGDLEQFI